MLHYCILISKRSQRLHLHIKISKTFSSSKIPPTLFLFCNLLPFSLPLQFAGLIWEKRMGLLLLDPRAPKITQHLYPHNEHHLSLHLHCKHISYFSSCSFFFLPSSCLPSSPSSLPLQQQVSWFLQLFFVSRSDCQHFSHALARSFRPSRPMRAGPLCSQLCLLPNMADMLR